MIWMAQRLAHEASGAWWLLFALETYLAVCLLTLAVLYGLRHVGWAVEDVSLRSRWSPLVRAILLPYLALAGLVLSLARQIDREDSWNPVAAGLYIGRLPSPRERAGLVDAGVGAVLNLCWEFPRPSGMGCESDLETAYLPLLDGSPPSDRQLREAVDRVVRWRSEGRTVLIYCAQGHGRSATIAAAVLCRLGLASGVQDAVSMIRAARPRARPSGPQRSALSRFLAQSGTTAPG